MARSQSGILTRGALPTLAGLAPAAPAVIGVLLLFIGPFVMFAIYSFLTSSLLSVSGPLTLDSYRAAFDSELYRTMGTNSAIIGAATALATVALGLPIAFWIRFCAGRFQTLVLFLFAATLFASYLVRIYAWRAMLGENGLLNSALTGLGVTDDPLGFLLFNRFAVVLGLVHIFLPYVVLVLYAAFRGLPSELLELADDLGARSVATWRRVILPIIAPALVTSGMFVFILAASDYVTPQFLGGTDGSMIGVGIQQAFIAQGNWPLGAAISLLTLLAFAVCYLIATLTLRLLVARPSPRVVA